MRFAIFYLAFEMAANNGLRVETMKHLRLFSVRSSEWSLCPCRVNGLHLRERREVEQRLAQSPHHRVVAHPR